MARIKAVPIFVEMYSPVEERLTCSAGTQCKSISGTVVKSKEPFTSLTAK